MLKLRRYIFIFLGIIFLILGAIGLFLPLLPSTPFGLLAIFFFSRSSPFLHQLCYKIPMFGVALKDWEATKSISPKSKVLAIFLLLFALVHLLNRPLLLTEIKLVVGLFIFGIMLFIFNAKTK